MEFDEVYEKVAKKNGVSKEEVIEEIKLSIKCAMENPEFKDRWDEIKGDKEEVTPDDLIKYLCIKVKKDLL